MLVLSLASAYVCLKFRLDTFLDFLIVGIIIAFPLTFSLRVAFRRRERALQYLSLFKGSLQSVAYAFGSSKLDENKKEEFKSLAANISNELIEYLLKTKNDAAAVQSASHRIYVFIQANRDSIKDSVSLKIVLFLFRINESIEFLLATRRHSIPWGPKAIVLFAIYLFVICYPASLLHRTGFDVSLLYVFLLTAFKALFLISFYNIQGMLADPFNQNSPDGIRVNDFRFYNYPEPPRAVKEKKNKRIEEDEDDID